MKKVLLITGGAGYIGGRLLEHFHRNAGWTVRVADRAGLLDALPLPDGAEKVPMELTDDESLSNACRDVNTVIHLAALNEIDSANDPEKAFAVTTVGTLKMLKAASARGVAKFLYFSTAHVYGAPLSGRIDENAVPRPVHPYSTSHKAAEDLVNEFHDRKKLTGIVLRLSNSFGYPYFRNINRWTLVVNDLCRQAIADKKLRLNTSGVQKRDFITLEDVCRGVEHLIGLDKELGRSNLFNLGGKNAVSIWDISRKIAVLCRETFGYEPPIERPAPEPGEKLSVLDYRIDRIERTGFRLKGNMDGEIRETLRRCGDWFGGGNAGK